MAANVNLNLRFVDSSNSPVASAAVSLLTARNNNLYQYNNLPYDYPQSVVSTGTTDTAGVVFLSGISAGMYDISITGASGTANIRNYQVKNNFPVAIGESNVGFLNSTYVASNESGTNILTQDKTTKAFNGNLAGNRVSVEGDVAPSSTGTVGYPIPIPYSGSEIFNTTVVYSNTQSGVSYYHNTTPVQFTQKARFTVSV